MIALSLLVIAVSIGFAAADIKEGLEHQHLTVSLWVKDDGKHEAQTKD